jgi:hypothetical protein
MKDLNKNVYLLTRDEYSTVNEGRNPFPKV